MKRRQGNRFYKIFNSPLFSQIFLPFFFPVLFFFIAVVTISDYGMNWDSPVHFARGQAYLRYILTGKSDYKGLYPFCRGSDGNNSRVDYINGEVCDKHRKVRVSEYESHILTFNWAKENDNYGHPPFSDIGMAITNQLFFKQLGWFEDIEAYHLFNVFATFLLVVTVAHWMKRTFGVFPAIISTLIIYLFPLLFAEQHFNVKDPPMAAFFTLGLYLFWLGMTSNRAKYIVLSAFAGGASFATKLNYVFAPVILLPWLLFFLHSLIRLGDSRLKRVKNISKKMLGALLVYPVTVFLVFFLSWPVLWSDPVKNIQTVISYYDGIGIKKCPDFPFSIDWILKCSDLFAVNYLVYTLPIVTIFFFSVGFFVALKKYKEKKYVTVLWLSFFLVTILRVTLSIAQIYGGLRQIIEIIAPIGLISGLGALFIRDVLSRVLLGLPILKNLQKSTITVISSALIILCFLPISLKVVTQHPHQNLYFNPLIGGIRGAAAKDFPGVGNSYGNVYFLGVKWLNEHAEKNARIALLSGLAQNLSRVSLRGDFMFLNSYLSSYNHLGEYLLLPISQGDPVTATFRYKFFNRFLRPVYKLEIEGVSILKIWKNDARYVKQGINLQDEKKEEDVQVRGEKKSVLLSLEGKKPLKRLEIFFPKKVCRDVYIAAQLSISSDGKNFAILPDAMNDFTIYEIKGYKGELVYLFAGDEARFIKVAPISDSLCRSDSQFSIYTFPIGFNQKYEE